MVKRSNPKGALVSPVPERTTDSLMHPSGTEYYEVNKAQQVGIRRHLDALNLAHSGIGHQVSWPWLDRSAVPHRAQRSPKAKTQDPGRIMQG